MALQPGSRIGSYEVRTPLGAGGMGEVYRAHDSHLGRDVALKTMPEAFGADPERVARFEREARILATLNHPNIATLFGSGAHTPVEATSRSGVSRRTLLLSNAAVGLLGVGFGATVVVPAPRPRGVAVVPAAHVRGAWRRAHGSRPAPPHRGSVPPRHSAPDFQTVLYGALWDGDVCRVYTVRAESPESSSIAVPPATPLAVSSTGEMALALGTHLRGIMTYGTLARVPMAGGAPRELQERVKYADWSPDGRDLAIVRSTGDRDVLEFPAGKAIAEAGAAGAGFSFPRVSPRGDAVAVFELEIAGALWGKVAIIDRSGARQALSARYVNVFGLAWHGDEVWFTAADELPLLRNAVYAMDASGAVRIVARVPGNASLHDIAPDGRVLIARTDDRGGISVRVPGEAVERELSWLDAPNLVDMSSDGRRVLFYELGVGGGPQGSVYLRGTDGSPAVRLGDGQALALSPDGRWAVVQTASTHLDLIPTGAGSSRRLEPPGLTLLGARWLPDGQRVAAAAERFGRIDVLVNNAGNFYAGSSRSSPRRISVPRSRPTCSAR